MTPDKDGVDYADLVDDAPAAALFDDPAEPGVPVSEWFA